MGNPLLTIWHRLVDPRPEPARPEPPRLDEASRATGAIFLVLRRMRAPLIVLIVVFAVSVLGLTLIPGQQADGGTEPMSFFDAFYFMTYTATTIGFGEIPDPLTTDQRVWVTFSIYMAVIGWAYAIGTLLALLQDRGFRRALAVQRFARQVTRMPEPFRIVVGHGQAGRLVVAGLDARGQRMVVLDRDPERIEALDLEPLHSDVPALATDGHGPAPLLLAGLDRPGCLGVLALTDDDGANLGIVQAAHLLRPDLPAIARCESASTARRMRAFGDPTIVNPYDAFGDRLLVALRSPALAQLIEWLLSPPGREVPERLLPPRAAHWVVVGPPRSAGEVGRDLDAAGCAVTLVDPADGEPADPAGAAFADLAARAAGIVVVAERDTETVSYVDAARRAHPGLFVVARQGHRSHAAVFRALAPDLLLDPAEVVAREVLERLANPVLGEFVRRAEEQDDAWAEALLSTLVARCGPGSPVVWQVRLDERSAPALVRRLAAAEVRLGALMPSPWDRTTRLALVPLMLVRGGATTLAPGEEVPLAVGDTVLAAGSLGAQRAWAATLGEDEALAYVLSGRAMATSWWGRRLIGAGRG